LRVPAAALPLHLSIGHGGRDGRGRPCKEAFLDSFSFALRAELKETGVTVTCLMPALANVTPSGMLAEHHRKMAEPKAAGSASQR
jgi:hypothetical protein